jgi:hypothetical protein
MTFVERRDLRLEAFDGVAVLVGEVDVDQHLHGMSHRDRVEQGGLADDDAVVLEALDSAEARCGREADAFGKLDVGEPAVGA